MTVRALGVSPSLPAPTAIGAMAPRTRARVDCETNDWSPISAPRRGEGSVARPADRRDGHGGDRAAPATPRRMRSRSATSSKTFGRSWQKTSRPVRLRLDQAGRLEARDVPGDQRLAEADGVDQVAHGGRSLGQAAARCAAGSRRPGPCGRRAAPADRRADRRSRRRCRGCALGEGKTGGLVVLCRAAMGGLPRAAVEASSAPHKRAFI